MKQIKIIILCSLTLGLSSNFFKCMAQINLDSVINVGILIYPGMELLDFSGPTDVFVKAHEATFGQYEIYTIGLSSEPILTQTGAVSIKPKYTVHDLPRTDIIIIPGSNMNTIDSLRQDHSFVQNVNRLRKNSNVTMTVCTGSYLLAATGALDNLSSTTHFFLADDFQQQYPHTKVKRNVRFVDEEHIITTSGITSGIDGALHLVKK